LIRGSGEVARRAEQLAKTADGALARSETAAGEIKGHAQSLTEAARQTQEEAARLRRAAADESTDLGRIAAELRELTQEIGAQLGQPTRELVAAAGQARETSREIRQELEAQAGDLAEGQEAALEALTRVGDLAERKAEALTQAAETALTRTQDLGKAMETRGTGLEKRVLDVTRRVEAMGQSFREQASDLIAASDAAAQQARELTAKAGEHKREVFLRSATVMIEELNSVAFDIDRLLEDDVPDDLLKRYQKGDRSVFARRLLRQRDRFTRGEVEKLYARDPKFRDQAGRYMSQFESLLNQANDSDPDQVLSAAFLTADVGKLYLLLARSLGRQQ
jgi:hypothetical protein